MPMIDTVGRFVFGGEVAVQQNVSSMIQDAAEERTFTASETVEQDISRRKANARKGARILERTDSSLPTPERGN